MAWFDVYVRELEADAAREELMTAQAVSLGTAIAYNGKDASVRRIVRDLDKRGWPRVYADGPHE